MYTIFISASVLSIFAYYSYLTVFTTLVLAGCFIVKIPVEEELILAQNESMSRSYQAYRCVEMQFRSFGYTTLADAECIVQRLPRHIA